MDYLNTIDGDAFAIDRLERGVAYGTWRSRPNMPASIDAASLVEMLDPDPEPLGGAGFSFDTSYHDAEDECDMCGAGPDDPCGLDEDELADADGAAQYLVSIDPAGPLTEPIVAELAGSEDVFGPDAAATRARIDDLEDQVAELELDRDLLFRVVRVNALVTHRAISPDESDADFLRGCVRVEAPVAFTYTDAEGESTERVVSPYEVKSNLDLPPKALLVGRCHLRGELRAFRVDRMEKIAPSMEHFQGGEGE